MSQAYFFYMEDNNFCIRFTLLPRNCLYTSAGYSRFLSKNPQVAIFSKLRCHKTYSQVKLVLVYNSFFYTMVGEHVRNK